MFYLGNVRLDLRLDVTYRVCLVLCFISMVGSSLVAADLEGRVSDRSEQPLAGVQVHVKGQSATTITDEAGNYRLALAKGEQHVVYSYFGQVLARNKVNMGGEKVTLNVTLAVDATFRQGLVVTSTRSESVVGANLSETVVRETPANVTGDLLRRIQGVDGVRRGPVGIDPVVRGLRETEVGAYLDGTRLFPAGPGRMDSALSHLDPSAVQRIQVVKGPYALTWGAGNLSAIRVETHDPNQEPSGEIDGNLAFGYHNNIDASNLAASLSGKQGRLGWWVHGVGREGGDYEDGDGNPVPADMESRELRAKTSWTLAENNFLTFSAGVQDQRHIDYPGRLLNANYFDTTNLSLRWNGLFGNSNLLRSWDALVYQNAVDHGMDNMGKPTALPNPNRVPPFALDVSVDAEVTVSGGRAVLAMAPSDSLSLQLGVDTYRAERDALRTIARADSGMIMFVDKMWPEAVIEDSGFFLRVDGLNLGPLRGGGTARLDVVDADAGVTSPFFQEHAGTDLHAQETHLSGALNLEANLSEHWLFAVGLGSAVRTADASERYSDRIPSSKAQMSAEFMGNPLLDPERGNQLDLWFEAVYPKMEININAFARRIDNYITIEATDLPRRLPLSPPTVFRYINGEAEFRGAESSIRYRFNSAWQLDLGTSYLWGREVNLHEPAFGITPLNGELRLHYRDNSQSVHLEMALQATSDQDRVATSRGETPTDGYVTADLIGHARLGHSLSLRLGALNLADERVVNHLNAKNPFTGQQVAEPGRVYLCELRFNF